MVLVLGVAWKVPLAMQVLLLVLSCPFDLQEVTEQVSVVMEDKPQVTDEGAAFSVGGYIL